MRKYKWGILAPGTIAHKFIKGLELIPEAVAYAVGSRDLTRAEAFARQYGLTKAYGSYRELAEDPDVDIIYVATPHPQHEEAAILCLKNGKAVICEKPIAANAKQAGRMVDCARANSAFLMEATWTRFLPTICKVRELIAAGAIGNLRQVYADFGFRAAPNPESRLFAPAAAGGALLDVGVYNLAFCAMLFGCQPERVQSHMVIGGTGVDEETAMLLSYPGGRSALLSCATRLGTPQEAKIFGEDGRIEIPNYWHSTEFTLTNRDGKQAFSLPFEATGYQYEALEVMRCLEAGLTESPVMPLDESVATMRTADGIRAEHGLRYPFE